jgi:hypothetical protein
MNRKMLFIRKIEPIKSLEERAGLDGTGLRAGHQENELKCPFEWDEGNQGL